MTKEQTSFKVSRLEVPSPTFFSNAGLQIYQESMTGTAKLKVLAVDVAAVQNQVVSLSPSHQISKEQRLQRTSPRALVIATIPLRKRSSSPSCQYDWQHLIGGNYNSPRCINTDHKDRKSPHFIRMSLFERKASLLDEDPPLWPSIIERREKCLMWSPQSSKISAYKSTNLSKSLEYPKEQRQEENPGKVEHENIDISKAQSPIKTVNISLSPRLGQNKFKLNLPRIKPKKRLQEDKKKSTSAACQSFDRQQLENSDIEMDGASLCNNAFYPRGVKNLTAYRHYTSYKLAIDELEERKQEEQKQMLEIPHKSKKDDKQLM